ncbi:cysteine hydrolase family protein [uncultured Jatrophihabitans sp.]|uniref:cysteine hydrolase family protein n=1 Tax=uncultured Jatrophihabitans sp. TaxID=1610747 RepID=UPI0035CCA422
MSEMQNGIADPAFHDTPLARQVAERGIVDKINALSNSFRRQGHPVIFCTVAAPADGWSHFAVNCALAGALRRDGRLVEGTRHAAVHHLLVAGDQDIISARNHGMSPFTGTALDATLRRYSINTVVLCGVSTNIALPGAATEAVGLGYTVVLAEDCTAGGTPGTHEMQIRLHFPLIATVSSAAEISEALIHLPLC